jgi:hypothetical protein
MGAARRECASLDVLGPNAREAISFFRNRPKVQACLRSMRDIGPDYLRPVQPLSTLLGGKAQRLRLAAVLSRYLPAFKRPGAHSHADGTPEEVAKSKSATGQIPVNAIAPNTLAGSRD